MKFLRNEETKKIIFYITFTVLLMALMLRFDAILNAFSRIIGIIYPFLVGGIIAFILNVILRMLELRVFKNVSFKTKNGRSFKRPICLFLTIAIMLSILFIVVFLLLPRFIEAVVAIVDQLYIFLPQLQSQLIQFFEDNEDLIHFINSLNIDYQGIFKQIADVAGNYATNLVSNLFNIVSSFAGTMFSFMISFIFAMYLLIQKEKLSRHLRVVLRALFPKKIEDKIEHILNVSFDTFSNFVSGQGLEAVVLGTLVGSCCYLFGLSYASVVGVIAAICSFIPMFGSMIALVIGTLIQFIVSPYQAIFFFIMMCIIQQIDGNLIYPNIMGNRIGLPAMYVLIAFTVGGSLMGLFGMLLFIPITSIIYDLFRDWAYERIEEKKLFESTPD